MDDTLAQQSEQQQHQNYQSNLKVNSTLLEMCFLSNTYLARAAAPASQMLFPFRNNISRDEFFLGLRCQNAKCKQKHFSQLIAISSVSIYAVCAYLFLDKLTTETECCEELLESLVKKAITFSRS